MQRWPCKSAVIGLAMVGTVLAAGPAKFDGEFVDKKFLNGQGVFEFRVHQSGTALEIGFDAGYSDGHGATSDATGAGKVIGNTAQFTWKAARQRMWEGALVPRPSTPLAGTARRFPASAR